MAICWVALAGFGYSQTKKNGPVKTMAAKPAAAKSKPVANTGPVGNTLLFEITGKGLKAPSYLFGTMHILCDKDATLSPNLKKAIKDVQVIYFELDLDDMGETMGAMKYLRMNEGQKLQDLLTPAEYARVEQYFKDNKSPLPLSFMSRFKPYFISALIGEQVMTCGSEQKNGMEQKIMKESQQYEREIKGLETAEYQAGLFDSIPYKKQAQDLVAYIDSIDNYKKATLEMVEVYRKQDLKGMDSLVNKTDPGMEQYMDLLLYNRNRRWVANMPNIMGPRTVLFAVGAGHLSGEEGVIALLRKKGYTVTPLKN
ncbi:TraB/GumN family protein [Paraflavitalea sp. CAU 1676]|uniref:TraB/GumN family protein n=1 Tax=Paraflavitalea sp. CAU 1676 TaxID=3032598 RepID=UPI0023DA5DC7|nr:TraB/GumN family protein [Paraflavitalea sp. CAU 1676]MDF2188031.1 TraB/GumN family protein [Paraflavitalea sp. CAU 1676]